MSLFCVPTGVMGSLSSELSVRFGLRGASHVITTGCTSSTDAFGYSMRQIQSGRMDRVLCGGADAPIALGIMKGFILMKILTDSWNDEPQQRIAAFFGRIETDSCSPKAHGCLCWKNMSTRKRSRRENSSGNRWLRIDLRGVPSRPLAGMWRRTGASHRPGDEKGGDRPEDVDYVNLHGTSTQLNDRIETRALKLALGEHARKTSRCQR